MKHAAPPIHFHYIVPVWGHAFSKLFAEICLPMLLTPGNLRSPKQHALDRFVIATTAQDWAYMQTTPAMQTLMALMEVMPVLVDGKIDISNPHAAMSECYAVAMANNAVVAGHTHFVFLTPDSIWSEGAFERLRELADEKYKVVMVCGLRVNQEGMSAVLADWLHEHPDNPAMSNSQMTNLMFDHMHQLSRAHNFLSDQFLNQWPSHIYWINDQERQIIAHCFHMHPLMVLAPKRTAKIGNTIDGDFLDNLPYPLESYYVVQNDFMGFDLAPAERHWGQVLASPSLKDINSFSLMHAHRKHWHFFSKRLVFSVYPEVRPQEHISFFIDNVVAQIYKNRYKAFVAQRVSACARCLGILYVLRQFFRCARWGKRWFLRCIRWGARRLNVVLHRLRLL